MASNDYSFRKLLPGFVISAGTQVVLKVAKALADGQQFKPPGSVGVVLESPPDNPYGSRRRLSTRPSSPSLSRYLSPHALQHDVLLPELVAGGGPTPGIFPQRLGSLLPVLAVHSTVGLRHPFRVTGGKQAQPIEAVSFEESPECLEGLRQQAAGAERMLVGRFFLALARRFLPEMADRPQDGAADSRRLTAACRTTNRDFDVIP